MKFKEKSGTLIASDYPFCLFLLVVIIVSLTLFIFIQHFASQWHNGVLGLLMAMVLQGYLKKRTLTLTKRNRNIRYSELSFFSSRTIEATFDDIETIEMRQGRSGPTVASRFVVIDLKNGDQLRLNELGNCIGAGHDSDYSCRKIKAYLK